MPRTSLPRFVLAAGLVTIVAAPASVAVNAQAQAQGLAAPRLGVPAVPPPERPVVLYTAAHPRIRVVPVATGLSHPWSMAFRRNGDILVTDATPGRCGSSATDSSSSGRFPACRRCTPAWSWPA